MIRRQLLIAGFLVSAVAFGQPALAQGTSQGSAPAAGTTQHQPSPAQAAQQERMRTCNAEAGNRKLAGDDRRGFMSECLAGRMPPADRQPSAAQQAQQDRMRSCNAEAGTRNLAGDARRSFMSDCLAGRTASGSGTAPATPPATSSRSGATR
jgi:hypothetical protein